MSKLLVNFSLFTDVSSCISLGAGGCRESNVFKTSNGDIAFLFDESPWWSIPVLPEEGFWVYLSQLWVSRDECWSGELLAAGIGSDIKLYFFADQAVKVSVGLDALVSAKSHSTAEVWDARLVGTQLMRHQYSLDYGRHYEISNDNVFDAAFALWLIYLRLSYPDVSLGLSQLPAIDKPLWKRLCQNIGVLCGRDPRPNKEIQRNLRYDYNDSPLSLYVEQSHFQELVKLAPVIPDRLLKVFYSSENLLEKSSALYCPMFPRKF